MSEPIEVRGQELFNHMSQEYGLTLLESEQDEIELIVKRMIEKDRLRQIASERRRVDEMLGIQEKK